MQERIDTPAAALWTAAYNGDSTSVERLLAEGVDVNLWDRYGRGGLYFAISGGHVAIVRFLVKVGAWVDPFDDCATFKSPLMHAAELGHVEIAEFLLDNGADPTKHGGVSSCTAEYYARNEHPFLAAILRRAEDQWRRSKR
jgi:ankyrin repeat protein